MKKSFRNQVTAAVVGLAAVFGGTPPASAAIVTGSWDPAFGPGPLQDLGWLTTINFFVPNQCFTSNTGPGISIFGNSHSCGGTTENPAPQIKVLSAEVGLYSLATNKIVDVLTFDPLSLPLTLLKSDQNDLLIFFLASQLSNVVQGGVPSDQDFSALLSQYQFRLRLNGSLPELQYGRVPDGAFVKATSPTLVGQSIDLDDSHTNAILTSTALRVGSLAIPEPTSVALVLLALVAGGLASRRRT